MSLSALYPSAPHPVELVVPGDARRGTSQLIELFSVGSHDYDVWHFSILNGLRLNLKVCREGSPNRKQCQISELMS